jgi:hypothetical protein
MLSTHTGACSTLARQQVDVYSLSVCTCVCAATRWHQCVGVCHNLQLLPTDRIMLGAMLGQEPVCFEYIPAGTALEIVTDKTSITGDQTHSSCPSSYI